MEKMEYAMNVRKARWAHVSYVLLNTKCLAHSITYSGTKSLIIKSLIHSLTNMQYVLSMEGGR